MAEPKWLAGARIPASWMPAAKMDRIIVHWTAGHHKASADDRKHYHVLVEADGKLVRGGPSIKLNEAPAKAGYAAHTLNCNSGSIGVSMCCMAGAIENPFDAGKSPMTKRQWDGMIAVVAQLCARYAIAVSPKTVLSHAEVQGTLGIKQRGKWDIARLAFAPSVKGAKACGDKMRREVTALLRDGQQPATAEAQVEVDTAPLAPATPPAPEFTEDEVKDVQERLLGHGYIRVGRIDGLIGDNTKGAIRDFRANNDLPAGEHIDQALIDKLKDPNAVRPVIAPERANATVKDLREEGSEIIQASDVQKIGTGVVVVGTAAKPIVDAITETSDSVANVAEKLGPFESLFQLVVGNLGWIIWAVIIAAGIFVGWKAYKIAKARVRDHRLGNTAVVNLPAKVETS